MKTPRNQGTEIQQLVVIEYKRLAQNNKESLNGDMLWSLAKKYVQAQVSADWLIFQSNYNIGAFK